MTSLAWVLPLLLLIAGGEPKDFPVDSTSAKRTDFSAFRTYSWAKGHEAYDKRAHKSIVGAVDAEKEALGITKVTAGSADFTIRYHAVRSSEVSEEYRQGGGCQDRPGRNARWQFWRSP